MKKIISVDGGGIRGIVPTYILHKIEEEMQEQLTDVVDLVAGTSTGSIVAGAISKGMPMGRLLEFYLNDGSDIFASTIKYKLKTLFGLFGSKYDIRPLEEKIKGVFGEMTMKDLHNDFLCTAYNMTKGKPQFFNGSNFSDTPIYKLITASTAAPTYFQPVDIKGEEYVDGGIFAPNPAMVAFTEAKSRYNLNAKDILLISMGTGAKNNSYNDVSNWFKLKWLNPLIKIMMSADVGTVHYQLAKIYGSVKQYENYYRINEFMPDNMDGGMTSASAKDIKDLVEFSKFTAKKNKKKIKEIAEALTR